MTLTKEEELRYNRQIILKTMDFDGQEALKKSSVLLIGLGGLGCAAAQSLAVSGIGHLTLVDDDVVSLSNLQRQVLHNQHTIGMSKVISAATHIRALNPHVSLTEINQRLSDNELNTFIQRHDCVLDCSDNLSTRNQLNQLCYRHKKPLMSAAAIRLEGQLVTFTYQDDEPCYACLSRYFGNQQLSCVENGILSPVVNIIGTMQALETIKLLTGLAPITSKKVTLFDAAENQWQTFTLNKHPDCIVCHQDPQLDSV